MLIKYENLENFLLINNQISNHKNISKITFLQWKAYSFHPKIKKVCILIEVNKKIWLIDSTKTINIK